MDAGSDFAGYALYRLQLYDHNQRLTGRACLRGSGNARRQLFGLRVLTHQQLSMDRQWAGADRKIGYHQCACRTGVVHLQCEYNQNQLPVECRPAQSHHTKPLQLQCVGIEQQW
jgi:hypothetical protein